MSSSPQDKQLLEVVLLTPREIACAYDGIEYELVDILNEYSKVDRKYFSPNDAQTFNFICKIIFSIEPASRNMKCNEKMYTEPMWDIHFEQEDFEIKTLKVTKCEPRRGLPKHPSGTLSVQQASLVAALKFCEIAETSKDQIMLTPMAKAVFSVEAIERIAAALQQSVVHVVKNVISSCQPCGQYLPSSSLACALVAKLFAMQNSEDEEVKAQVLKKTFKQYYDHGKEFCKNEFSVYYQHAMEIEIAPNMDMFLNDEIYGMTIAPLRAFNLSNESRRHVEPDMTLKEVSVGKKVLNDLELWEQITDIRGLQPVVPKRKLLRQSQPVATFAN